jgi:hypothetical protein
MSRYHIKVMCSQNGGGLKQATINWFFPLIYKPFPQIPVPIYQLHDLDTGIEQKQRKLLTVLNRSRDGSLILYALYTYLYISGENMFKIVKW